MADVLNVFAGPGAIDTLTKEGFTPQVFRYFLGASGGPKWFVLAGLDRVIVPQWLSGFEGAWHCIGSSAGAFRVACMGQADPLAAINRLADRYSRTVYSAKPTSAEITDKARELISDVIGPQNGLDIMQNPMIKSHILVAKCRGLMQSAKRPVQLSGLAMSAAVNALGRRHLERLYSRYVFSSPQSSLDIFDPYDIHTEHRELKPANIKEVLLASGSIPMVLDGVQHIAASEPGVYRDCGILDYHFDLAFGPEPGLVLYPHFYAKPITGWFDKMHKRRLPHEVCYHNMVMLVPSDSFVASLPYGKIPDRKDFENFDADTRIRYWQTVLKETDRLGDAFMTMVENGSIMDKIKPLPFATSPVQSER